MKKITLACACLFLVAACGSNNGTNNGTTGSNNGSTTGSNNGATTGPNNGSTTGPNNGSTTGPNNGEADMGAANGDAGGTPDMGGTEPDAGGGDPDAGGGDMRLQAHDCTFDTAMDMTGNATVSISDLAAWTFGHQLCVKVTTGTVASWSGNFSNHPLDGGVSPTADAANPIEIAGAGVNGNTTIDVTFDTAGDYPYFCGIHVDTMVGVVYVVD